MNVIVATKVKMNPNKDATIMYLLFIMDLGK